MDFTGNKLLWMVGVAMVSLGANFCWGRGVAAFAVGVALVVAPPQVIAEIRRGSEQAEAAINDSGSARERVPWCEYLEDLERASKAHPLALILVTGQGEEAEDRWEIRVRRGVLTRRRARFGFGDWELIPPGKGPR